jgi:uncharacterized protein YegP (UPF0339 family)
MAPGPGSRHALTSANDQTSLAHTKEVARAGQKQRAEFKVRKDQDGRYPWHLQSASNRIIAWSGQAYDSKYWCVQDLNWLRANANLIMVYDYTGELAPQPPR